MPAGDFYPFLSLFDVNHVPDPVLFRKRRPQYLTFVGTELGAFSSFKDRIQ